jgi:beta-galactosidase GanA
VHPWRLPVPALWIDLLEKIKAAGLNTVSIYVNWALVSPSRGVTDWTGYRDLQRFCEICREVGLWLILRPGPHIQAEASAGGIAYCTLSGLLANFRRARNQH